MNGAMTPQEVADRLKVSRDTVLRWLRSGKLPAAHLGHKTYRITEDALEAFMRGEQTKGPKKRPQTPKR